MALPSVIERILRRPGMYVRSETVDSVFAFLEGYDQALEGGFLVGFREWLITQLGDANYGNLAWSALVEVTFERKRLEGRAALDEMFALLEAFTAARSQRDGLRSIFLKYEALLRRKSWYGPGSPGWIPIHLPLKKRARHPAKGRRRRVGGDKP
jgi:hypothetical protein